MPTKTLHPVPLAQLLSIDVNNLPLTQLYDRASQVYRERDALFSNRAEHASDLHAKALELCRALVAAVNSAAVFSSNEDADDIATGDLKLLLSAFYLAELLISCPAQGGPTHRDQLVSEAIHNYNAFLQSCNQYGLLAPVARQLYEQSEQGEKMDPTSKRAAKIERFKADKALQAQIAMLQQQKSTSHHKQEDDSSESGPVGGATGWDEEDERQLTLALIQQAVITALGQREMAQEEKTMLQHVIQAEKRQAGSQGLSEAQLAVEAAQHEQVMSQLKKIALDLGTATTKRQQLASEVFRPSHTLPTRTLAEQAEIEMEDARRREQAERAARQAEARRKEELGSDEDEEELRQQRAWDDWKDSNPKGWGNSKLRPTG